MEKAQQGGTIFADGDGSPPPPLALDSACSNNAMEAVETRSHSWSSAAALNAEELKGNGSCDEDSTTGMVTVDELEHELAVERTKRMEVSLELQESARVGQLLLDRNEQLEQEVLKLQQRLEASRSEAVKDSDSEAGSRAAEVEWQLQQSARVGQMLLDRNEELEREAQFLRKQVEAAGKGKSSKDSESESEGWERSAPTSFNSDCRRPKSRSRAASECSSRRGRNRRSKSSVSEGSDCHSRAVSKDRVMWSDANAVMARNEELEIENEQLREQFMESMHRKHGARRRFSTGMCLDVEPGHHRTETLSGEYELSEHSHSSSRRRFTSSAAEIRNIAREEMTEDVIQGYGGARDRSATAHQASEWLKTPSTDSALLRERLDEACEQNRTLGEECERLEVIVRKQLVRERELTDLLQQERAAAEWAAKEAAREVHGARQAGLDAGLTVVRERRRSDSCVKAMSARLSSDSKRSSLKNSGSAETSEAEDDSEPDTVQLQERVDELEVKYNEAKNQAWEAHQDMMNLRNLLSQAQVNCQDLEDMAAEKQLALEEEQRRNASLSEQIQELRQMLEDQRKRQSVLMMCKNAISADGGSEGSSSGSNQKDGTFLDLVHLHRLASRALPFSGMSSRASSRESIRSTGAESMRSRLSLREAAWKTCASDGGRDTAWRTCASDESLDSLDGVRPSESLPSTPRSRLLNESHLSRSRSSRSSRNALTLNSLLRMEDKRISERSEEEREWTSPKDPQSLSSLNWELEKASSEGRSQASRRSPDSPSRLVDNEDSADDEEDDDARSPSDVASSQSSNAGDHQSHDADGGVEEFNRHSRALLQALLTVTREKRSTNTPSVDTKEARAAKVRELFLNDIAKVESSSSHPGRVSAVAMQRPQADAELPNKSQQPAKQSRFKILQARWQRNFAKEVAALDEPPHTAAREQSRRNTTATCSTTETGHQRAQDCLGTVLQTSDRQDAQATAEGKIGVSTSRQDEQRQFNLARSVPVTRKEVSEAREKCIEQVRQEETERDSAPATPASSRVTDTYPSTSSTTTNTDCRTQSLLQDWAQERMPASPPGSDDSPPRSLAPSSFEESPFSRPDGFPRRTRLRTVTEGSSESTSVSPARSRSGTAEKREWRRHADFHDAEIQFFHISSDGEKRYKRRPTQSLDTFLEGLEFPEEVKRHSEPPIRPADLELKSKSEAGVRPSSFSNMETQSNMEVTKDQGRVRRSWMHRAGWRRGADQEDAGSTAAPANTSSDARTPQADIASQRRKWSFAPSKQALKSLFKGSSRSSETLAAATAVRDQHDLSAARAKDLGAAAAKDADDFASASAASSSASGLSQSPYQSAVGSAPQSLAGSPEKAISPDASFSAASKWRLSWGGSPSPARQENPHRSRPLRVTVGGLDEGAPIQCEESHADGMSEANAAPATGQLPPSPPHGGWPDGRPPPTPLAESWADGPPPMAGSQLGGAAATSSSTAAQEDRRTSTLEPGSSFCGQCRNCGQLKEFCECEVDASLLYPDTRRPSEKDCMTYPDEKRPSETEFMRMDDDEDENEEDEEDEEEEDDVLESLDPSSRKRAKRWTGLSSSSLDDRYEAIESLARSEELKRLSTSTRGGQCRNCGQHIEYCECGPDMLPTASPASSFIEYEARGSNWSQIDSLDSNLQSGDVPVGHASSWPQDTPASPETATCSSAGIRKSEPGSNGKSPSRRKRSIMAWMAGRQAPTEDDDNFEIDI